LAIVVIGGLISSTVLTLIVLPVLYNIVEGGRERRKINKAAKKAQKLASTPNATQTAPATSEPVFETLVIEDDTDGDDDPPIRRRSNI
jgi:HAE1 family hydrophobic/amphiphilic exporter-1